MTIHKIKKYESNYYDNTRKIISTCQMELEVVQIKLLKPELQKPDYMQKQVTEC